MRTAIRQLNEHRAVFHGDELALFWGDGTADHEDDMVFYNEVSG